MKLSNGFTTYDVSVYTSNDDYLVDETQEHYFESMHDGRYYEAGDKSELMWELVTAPDAVDMAEYMNYSINGFMEA